MAAIRVKGNAIDVLNPWYLIMNSLVLFNTRRSGSIVTVPSEKNKQTADTIVATEQMMMIGMEPLHTSKGIATSPKMMPVL